MFFFRATRPAARIAATTNKTKMANTAYNIAYQAQRRNAFNTNRVPIVNMRLFLQSFLSNNAYRSPLCLRNTVVMTPARPNRIKRSGLYVRDRNNEPVQLVFSQAEKSYKKDLSLEEALDASVRLKPLVVVNVVASTGEISEILVPLPQNRWGPNVVMPLL